MRIKEIKTQNRRDFKADYECEHCGFVKENGYGYDDDFFHKRVIPTMECDKCGKIAGSDYVPRTTKYEAWEVV